MNAAIPTPGLLLNCKVHLVRTQSEQYHGLREIESWLMHGPERSALPKIIGVLVAYALRYCLRRCSNRRSRSYCR